MIYDLQKAGLWKRIAAWMLDAMLLAVLAVGCCLILSSLLGYDGYTQTWDDACARYEQQYSIEFAITQEKYESFSAEEKQAYDSAYEQLITDDQAMYAYNMMVNLMLVIATMGILLATILLEFAVPLLFGNGQTLGKKMFSLCVVHKDCIKVNPLQMFTRSVLGKFAIETMIPAYVILMQFWGTISIFGHAIMIALLLGQCICIAVTKNHSAIHDLLAGTAVADMSSQMIFATRQDLVDYQKIIHAEQAARQDY